MAKAPKRPRAERREKARALDKLGRALDRAAEALPGGSPERPLMVLTAAAAEGKARGQPCPRCEGDVDVANEAVEFRVGQQLRRFEVVCRRCHTRRTIWLALGGVPAN